MKKNGFTLVEILMALAILSILSIGFLSVISNNLNFIKANSRTTSDYFDAQKKIELEIDSVRANIDDPVIGPTMSYDTLHDVFEPGIDVTYHTLKKTVGNQSFYVLLSNAHPEEFPVPALDSVTTILKSGTTEVKNAYAVTATNIEGDYVLSSVNADTFLINTYHWYVSREGFNIPVPKTGVSEMEWGYKYPIFPDDYSMIPNETDINLTDVTAFGGRHIVLAVTPAAKSGRLGKTVPSHPIYISGLPVIGEPVVLHLDGSVIDFSQSSEVTQSGNHLLLNKWIDLSNYRKDAYPSNSARRPDVVEMAVDGDFSGKYVAFDGSDNAIVNHSGLVGSTLNVFAVSRGDEATSFIKNGTYGLQSNGEVINDEWRLTRMTYTADSNNFVFGEDDVDVAEIIVIQGTMTADEIESIETYLKSKYVRNMIIGNIDYIYDQTVTIYKDEPFTLPYALKAKMESGTELYVPVTFNGTVDTSTAHTIVLTARSTMETTKTATYTVIVKERKAVQAVTLSPKNLMMPKGQITALTATVSPEDAYDKTASWNSSNTSVATVDGNGYVTAIGAGDATITVTTNDGGYTDTSKVEVISDELPSGLVLRLDASTFTNTGSISTWEDISGRSNDFYQYTSSRRPQVAMYNGVGLPVVNFIRSNREYLTNDENNISGVDFFAGNGSQATMFFVAQANYKGDDETIFSKSNGWGSSSTYVFGFNYNGQFETILRGLQGSANVTAGNEDYNLHTSVIDNNAHLYFLNGEEVSNFSHIGTASNQTNRSVMIGASDSSSSSSRAYLDGNIAEILVFNRVLTTSERERVEDYLIDKWITIPAIYWRFTDNLESWTAQSDISGFTHQSSGAITGTITGADPYIISANSLGANINSAKRIKIRLKNSTNSNLAQIYFTTNADSTMNEAKHIDFAIIPNSDYVEYEIDMESISGWQGTLRRLRIDPAVGVNSGSFTIDQILIIE